MHLIDHHRRSHPPLLFVFYRTFSRSPAEEESQENLDHWRGIDDGDVQTDVRPLSGAPNSQPLWADGGKRRSVTLHGHRTDRGKAWNRGPHWEALPLRDLVKTTEGDVVFLAAW